MIYGLVLIIHVLLSLFMIGFILIQGGRGGLGEAMGGAAAQSLFGGSATTVMTKITAVIAGLFMVTCLSLAILSTAKGRSVIDQFPTTMPKGLPPIPGLPISTTEPASSATPAAPVPEASEVEPSTSPASAGPQAPAQ